MFKYKLIQKSFSFLIAGAVLISTCPISSAEDPPEPQVQGENVGLAPNPMTSQMTPPMTNMSSPTSMPQAMTIPAGTSLTIRNIGSIPDQIGEMFTGQIVNPVMVNGQELIPAGSHVHGTVVNVNPTMGTTNIQFREVAFSTGETIPISSRATIRGGVARQQQQQVVQQTAVVRSGLASYYPRVSIGPDRDLPAGGTILATTVAGAAFGAITGTISGAIMPAVYGDDIDYSEGTGALRGMAWGAAAGAAVGLVGGIIAAATDRRRCVVTASCPAPAYMTPQCPTGGLTNIQRGEVPVAYQSGEFQIILDQPVTITR